MTDDYCPFHISLAECGLGLGESWPITHDIFSSNGETYFISWKIFQTLKSGWIRTDEINTLVRQTKQRQTKLRLNVNFLSFCIIGRALKGNFYRRLRVNGCGIDALQMSLKIPWWQVNGNLIKLDFKDTQLFFHLKILCTAKKGNFCFSLTRTKILLRLTFGVREGYITKELDKQSNKYCCKLKNVIDSVNLSGVHLAWVPLRS